MAQKINEEGTFLDVATVGTLEVKTFEIDGADYPLNY